MEYEFLNPTNAIKSLRWLAKNPWCRVWGITWKTLRTKPYTGRK